MAHFAELNEDNVVLRVIVVDNQKLLSENGVENEELGIDFCKKIFGKDTIWKQTSYNARIRKNYAGVGYIYDPVRDAFMVPKPYDSWILDETTCRWIAPVPRPDNNKFYIWDEPSLSWKELPLAE